MPAFGRRTWRPGVAACDHSRRRQRFDEVEVDMGRNLTVGAAQLGPIGRKEPRSSAVGRMIALLREAKSRSCELVVFPEMALTTFFPRWHITDGPEIEGF